MTVWAVKYKSSAFTTNRSINPPESVRFPQPLFLTFRQQSSLTRPHLFVLSGTPAYQQTHRPDLLSQSQWCKILLPASGLKTASQWVTTDFFALNKVMIKKGSGWSLETADSMRMCHTGLILRCLSFSNQFVFASNVVMNKKDNNAARLCAVSPTFFWF